MTPEIFRQAKYRAKAKRLFWKNCQLFVVANLFILFSIGRFFFLPAGIYLLFVGLWLVVLFFHFKTVYPEMNIEFWKHDWEEKEIKKEIGLMLAEEELAKISDEKIEEIEMQETLNLKAIRYESRGDSDFV